MPDKRLGILVGGGHCPGLNSVLRAVARRAPLAGFELLGIKNGWGGLVEGDIEPLTRYSVMGIHSRGGIILGTSRINPLRDQGLLRAIHENWQRYSFSALIVVGGDGTLSGAKRMWHEQKIPIIGIPATIDNDIPMTDYTVGFHTAVSIATDIIDRLHTTAEVRHQLVVTEVMGGHSGWIATYAGLAASANAILIPEFPFRISELCALIKRRERVGMAHSLIVVAEAAMPHNTEDFLTTDEKQRMYQDRHLAGIGTLVAREIERMTGIMTRVSVLGPILMGGSPNAYDRILGSRFGLYAVEIASQAKFGCMVALQGGVVTHVPLENIADKVKPVNETVFKEAEIFFG